MNNPIIPFKNILKGLIFTGHNNEYIHSWFFEHSLDIKKDDINIIRQECSNTVDGQKMIQENTARLTNDEPLIVLNSVAAECKYPDDFKTIIRNFSIVTPILHRGKLLDFEPAFIFHDDRKRKLAENFSMTYNDFSILQLLAADLEIEFESEEIYDRYIHWFWDIKQYSQYQLSQYLREHKDHCLYRFYINPVRDGIEAIKHSFGQINEGELIRNIACINYQLQNELKRNLDLGEEINSRVIANFRSTQNNLNRLGTQPLSSEEETVQEKKYNQLMRKDGDCRSFQHEILVIPHENAVRLLCYLGFPREKITDILYQSGFMQIPDCFLESIADDCLSFPEGKKMMTENKTKLQQQKTLSNSSVVRETFKYKAVYDEAFKRPFEIYKLDDIMFKDILHNPLKRRLLDCCIIVDTPLARIQEAWKQFKEELTVEQYNSYKYYIFNLCHEFEAGLFQYLEQNPENQLYQGYKYFLGKTPRDVMIYFGLVTVEEMKEYNKILWGKANFDLIRKLKTDPLSVTKSEMMIYRSLDKRVEKQFFEEKQKKSWDKELQRIFARIIGKVRYNLTQDQIKNKRRIARVPEKDEFYEIKRK